VIRMVGSLSGQASQGLTRSGWCMTLPTQQLCDRLDSSVKPPARKELSMRIASGPRWGWAAFAAVCLTACSSHPSSSAPTLAPSTKEPIPALNGSYTFTTDGARLTR
jgi:hypothetical protein